MKRERLLVPLALGLVMIAGLFVLMSEATLAAQLRHTVASNLVKNPFCGGASGTSCDRGTVSAGDPYHWQVDAVDEHDATTLGLTWGPAAAPFTVNSTADSIDTNPGDGICQTALAGQSSTCCVSSEWASRHAWRVWILAS